MATRHRTPPSRWQLERAEVAVPGERTPFMFTGSLELRDSVKVLIERVARGPLWISVRSDRPERSIGTFYRPTGEVDRAAPGQVDIFMTNLPTRADSGRTVLLALFGDVWIGRPVGVNTAGSTSVVRSGSVSMIGRTLFSGEPFEGGTVSLGAGDQVVAEPEPSPARGFVVADERSAIAVAYQVVGRRVEITRPGGGTFPVTASLLDRVVRDRLSQSVSLAFAGLVALISVASFSFSVLLAFERPSQSK